MGITIVDSLSAWSDDALQREAQSLYGLIHNDEGCFGTKDLIRYHFACAELAKRGYQVKEHSHLLFKKI